VRVDVVLTLNAHANVTTEYFVLHCKSVVEMTLNAPYVFRKLDPTQETGEYAFSLSYVTLAKFMPLLTQVFQPFVNAMICMLATFIHISSVVACHRKDARRESHWQEGTHTYTSCKSDMV
jgi:hypothetical protein